MREAALLHLSIGKVMMWSQVPNQRANHKQHREVRRLRVNSQAPDFTVPAIGISEPANATQSRQSEVAYRGSESRRIGAQALMGSDEVRAEHISPRVIRNIAERVVRAISLDLKLERERRGVTKWR